MQKRKINWYAVSLKNRRYMNVTAVLRRVGQGTTTIIDELWLEFQFVKLQARIAVLEGMLGL